MVCNNASVDPLADRLDFRVAIEETLGVIGQATHRNQIAKKLVLGSQDRVAIAEMRQKHLVGLLNLVKTIQRQHPQRNENRQRQNGKPDRVGHESSA